MSGRVTAGPRPVSLPVTPAPLGVLQTQLRVSRGGDVHEREADRIADHVAGPAPTPVASAPAPVAPDAGAAVDRAAAVGPGSPLAPDTRRFFEERMGHDFGSIRVHADSPSDQAASALQARAFTRGEDLFFAENEYRPAAAEGRHLLAHELTHTVQQRGGSAGPDTIARKEAPPALASAADAAVSEIAAILAEGRDGAAARVYARITALDPLTRLVVVPRVLSLCPPGAREELAALLRDPAPTPPSSSPDGARETPGDAARPGSRAPVRPPLPPAGNPPLLSVPPTGDAASPTPTVPLAQATPRGPEKPPGQAVRAEKAAPAAGPRAGTSAADDSAGEMAGPVGGAAVAVDLGTRVAPPAAGPAAPGSAPPGADAQAFVARLVAAAAYGEQTVAARAGSARGTLVGRAAALRATVRKRVETRISEVQAAFLPAHDHLEVAVAAAHKQIAVDLKQRRTEVETSRGNAHTRFTKQFADHLKNVDTVFNNAVAGGNKLKTDAQDRVRRETSAQAATARNKGKDQAAVYPDTERGAVQKEAVRAVADATATEMQEKVPEAVAACGDVVEELPKGFQEGSAQILESFDEGLPAILTWADEQAEVIQVDLGPQAASARAILDTQVGEARTQLHSLERQIVAQGREIEELLLGQIDTGLRAALAQMAAGASTASGRIRGVIDQATAMLIAAGTPDPEAAGAFTTRIETFASEAASGAGDLLQETAVSATDTLGLAVKDADTALRQMEQHATRRRSSLSVDIDTAITTYVTAVGNLLSDSVARLLKAYDDQSKAIDTHLAAALTLLKATFDKTLAQAGQVIAKMVDAGIHENENLLFTLEVEMRRAANEEAWDFDHPWRAGTRIALEIVGGIVLGLLAVALLVVVAIVAFKGLVAGLVAVGVPAAIAGAIALILGLGLLAYGVYGSYSTRRRHEESVGDALLGAVLDVTGINEIIRGALRPHLSPFERFYSMAHGVGTLAALILPFAKGRMKTITDTIDSFLPKSVVNPVQGSASKAVGRALGIGKSANPLGGGAFGGTGVFPELESVPLIEPPRLSEPLKVAELPPTPRPAQVAEAPRVAGRPPAAEPGTAPPPPKVTRSAAVPEIGGKPLLPEVRPPGPGAAANDNVIPLNRGARAPGRAVPEPGVPKPAAPKLAAPKPAPATEPLPAHAQRVIEVVEAAEAAEAVEAEAALAAAEVVPRQAAMGDGLRPGGGNRLTVRNAGPGGGKGPSGPHRPPPPGRGSSIAPQRPAPPRRIGPKGIEPAAPLPPEPTPPEPTLPEQLEAIFQKEPKESAKDLATLAAEREPQLKALDEQIERLTRVIEGLGEQRTKEGGYSEGPNGERLDPRQELQEFIGELQARRSALQAERDPLARDLARINRGERLNAYRLYPEWKTKLPCFGAGTPVWTESGPRPIEAIRQGDRVWAFSFASDRPELCPVIDVVCGLTDHFYRVRSAEQTLPATGAHPFWVEELSTWLPARELMPGMRLRGLDPASAPAVDAVELVELPEPHATFNLSVDGAPSFYVGPGILVHNVLPPLEALPPYDFGHFIVYEGVYTGPITPATAKYQHRIYIGQTARTLAKRQWEHRSQAVKELKRTDLTPEQREFWEFKRHMELRPRVAGLDEAQADYFEQLHLNEERQLAGQQNEVSSDTTARRRVVYRREQISAKRFSELTEMIAKDPRVRKAGFCLR